MAGKRLRAIASLAPPCRVAADIGCDHGLLSDLLLSMHRGLFVIASDVSSPSLQKARRLLQTRHSAARFDLRLGSGLRVLSRHEADLIIIAGVGGRNIIGMLEEAPGAQGAASLLLSPHRNDSELRTYLFTHGYEIADEWILRERGRFYPLLLVHPGSGSGEEDPFWHWIGRPLKEKRDAVTSAYIRAAAQRTAAALRCAEGHDIHKAAQLQARLMRLNKEFADDNTGTSAGH